MKRVDFIGVPGVGKTTIINSLFKNINNRIWLKSSEAKHKILFENFKKSKKEPIDIIKDISYRINKDLFSPSFDSVKLTKFNTKNIQKYNEILEQAIKVIVNDKNIPAYINTKRISWLISTFEKVGLLDYYCKKDVVLFDDSLLMQILNLIQNEKIVTKDYEFINNLILPNGFIYVKLNSEEILKRLKNRDRITHDHVRFNEKELKKKIEKQVEYLELSYSKLQVIGVKGLVVDSFLPINQNIHKINEYLKNYTI